MPSRLPTVRRALVAAATLVVVAGLAGCSGDDTSAADSGSASGDESTSASGREAPADAPSCSYNKTENPAAKDVALPPDKAVITGDVDAEIETSLGTLKITLDGENAPCTVNSFVSLADQGYFDDTSCHRLTTGQGLLVLQCGDPSGTGAGGPGYQFDDELSGEETYGAGTLAMANGGANSGTNGSQFFIVYDDSQLPPYYTVFGSIDDASVQLVRDAAQAGTDNANGPGDGAPVTPVDITSVTVED